MVAVTVERPRLGAQAQVQVSLTVQTFGPMAALHVCTWTRETWVLHRRSVLLRGRPGYASSFETYLLCPCPYMHFLLSLNTCFLLAFQFTRPLRPPL